MNNGCYFQMLKKWFPGHMTVLTKFLTEIATKRKEERNKVEINRIISWEN